MNTGIESTMPSADEVKDILRQKGALNQGHFVLASGNHSEHYVQTAQLMKDPVLVDELLRDFFEDQNLSLESVETVLTAAKGGITVAQQVAHVLGKEAVFAERNDDNELALKRGFEITSGQDTLLVEDVVTTGGTLEELRELAERQDANVKAAFVLVNRSGRDEIDGVPLHALVDVTFPVYDPDECPQCSNGDEAVRPGTKKVNSS